MDNDHTFEILLNFFKALADSNRLKIVGLLAKQDLSVEQLAEMLDLQSPTVSHHLAKLAKIGLVSARSESYYSIYHLETDKLEALSQSLLAKETFPAVTSDINLDAYDQKVIKNYSNPDGSLKDIPTQQKKLLAVLRYVVHDFEFEKKYTEKQVNEILSQYHQDYAFLRRELVDFHFMQRDSNGTSYWRNKDNPDGTNYSTQW
ncbi:MAG: metalloregulator ArsR/SmtB family transcription factor [Anaerolineaceae bacterium]